jgi:DNA-binding response OmpR family regulator
MQRILVVEDEPFVYDAIKAALAFKGGFDVSHAADGEAAIAILAQEVLDLAFVDVFLPKMSGVEVAERAFAHNVPVILMSGHPDVITKPENYRFPILAKPFRLSYFLERLDQILAEADALKRDAMELDRFGEAPREQGRSEVATALAKDKSSARWRQVGSSLLGDLRLTD